MATKPKKPSTPPAPKDEALPPASKVIELQRGKTPRDSYQNFANTLTSPELSAYRVVSECETKSGFQEHIDASAFRDAMRGHVEAVHVGDMRRAEAMLINQATALQAIFVKMNGMAVSTTQLSQLEICMRLALRAQNQCRATLETLATIKNPPIVFAKQANIANGPQQVNNGVASAPRAGENEIPPTQLLEVDNGRGLVGRGVEVGCSGIPVPNQ